MPKQPHSATSSQNQFDSYTSSSSCSQHHQQRAPTVTNASGYHDSSVRLYIEQQVAGWIREQGGTHFAKRSRQPTTLARATVELITSFLHSQRCSATPLVQVAFHYAETYVRRSGLCHMDAFDILLTRFVNV